MNKLFNFLLRLLVPGSCIFQWSVAFFVDSNNEFIALLYTISVPNSPIFSKKFYTFSANIFLASTLLGGVISAYIK